MFHSNQQVLVRSCSLMEWLGKFNRENFKKGGNRNGQSCLKFWDRLSKLVPLKYIYTSVYITLHARPPKQISDKLLSSKKNTMPYLFMEYWEDVESLIHCGYGLNSHYSSEEQRLIPNDKVFDRDTNKAVDNAFYFL